jgi:hypothetical protein
MLFSLDMQEINAYGLPKRGCSLEKKFYFSNKSKGVRGGAVG